ncbi:MAG: permease [Candidatus Woesearchaeota archaeon]
MKKKIFSSDIIILLIVMIASILLMIFYPEKIGIVTDISSKYLLEMFMILPAVLILMGLFAVFVPNELVLKHLGKTSGLKGMFTAIILGAIPTGPLYVAFPLASTWLKKGASIKNIVVFLSAWACIKIPQEIVELQFLGFEFMLLRLILTIIFVFIMGIIMEKIINYSEKQEKVIV